MAMKKISQNTYCSEPALESLPCLTKDCCIYKGKELSRQRGDIPSPKDKSRKLSLFSSTKSREKSHIRQRHRMSSSTSESGSCGTGIETLTEKNSMKCDYSKIGRKYRVKTPPTAHRSRRNEIPYFIDEHREKYRLQREYRYSISPVRTNKVRSRNFNNHSKTNEKHRSQKRPRTPPTPDKQKEKVPYFADTVRERDRLLGKYKSLSPRSKGNEKERSRRRPRTPPTPDKLKDKVPYFADTVREKERLDKYKSSSPIVTSSRQRSKSRLSRRYRSRSRSCSSSRSLSYQRKRRSDRHRYKRDGSPHWQAAPQLIPVPVPVPDYAFAFQPYHAQHGWPPFPMRPTRYPYFPLFRDRLNRQAPFNTTPPGIPSSLPSPPTMRYGMPHPNAMPPMRTPWQGSYRYPFSET